MPKTVINHRTSGLIGVTAAAGQRIEPSPAMTHRDNDGTRAFPTWLQAMTPGLRHMLKEALGDLLSQVEEIRLRIGRPVLIRMGEKEATVNNEHRLTPHLWTGVPITRQELERNLEVLSQSSLYAWEDEFKNGYLTIPGGHRVGLAGRAVLEKGEIKTLKDISGFNYRVGREIRGCSDGIMPFVVEKGGVYNTLIVSPPRCGKTTLLRDMVRQLSNGVERLGFGGTNVGLVDERSEIAGMYLGEPQFDIGLRTDVLDACPKAQGMMMLIRAMSPGVIATDEIGKQEDVLALYESMRAGVSVIATVHGSGKEDVLARPVLKDLLRDGFFERLVVLSRRRGAGTLESIHAGKTLERMK